MKRILAFVVLGALPLYAQTADEIVSKALAARGGRDRILAVKTLRMTGQISFSGEDEGKIVVTWKRAGKFRQEVTQQGKSFLRATDGSNAWARNQLAGDTAAKSLPPEQMDGIREQADFDKPLVDYREKGNRVELVGREDLDGRSAYKLKVTLKTGAVRYEWIDAGTFLEARWQGKVSVGGKDTEFATTFRDYRTVEGMPYPFEVDTETIGSDQRQKIVFTSIEVNPPVADDVFTKPAPDVPPPG